MERTLDTDEELPGGGGPKTRNLSIWGREMSITKTQSGGKLIDRSHGRGLGP